MLWQSLASATGKGCWETSKGANKQASAPAAGECERISRIIGSRPSQAYPSLRAGVSHPGKLGALSPWLHGAPRTLGAARRENLERGNEVGAKARRGRSIGHCTLLTVEFKEPAPPQVQHSFFLLTARRTSAGRALLGGLSPGMGGTFR